MPTELQQWSNSYYIAPSIDVDTYPDRDALMDAALWDQLVEIMGREPIAMIEGLHYEFVPSQSVLSDHVAVPDANHDRDDLTVLLLK